MERSPCCSCALTISTPLLPSLDRNQIFQKCTPVGALGIELANAIAANPVLEHLQYVRHAALMNPPESLIHIRFGTPNADFTVEALTNVPGGRWLTRFKRTRRCGT